MQRSWVDLAGMTRGRRWVSTVWTALVVAILMSAGAGLAPSPVRAAPPASAPAGVERFVIVPASSEALYRVGETFLNRGNQFKVAVGSTHGIQGQILVDRAHPRQTRIDPITVDISQLVSDSRRRDREIQSRWLESAKYPTAVFTPTAIDGLPSAYVDGQSIPVRIAGNLRVRDVTKPVTFTGTVTLTGGTLAGKATTSILMTDFGFDPPSIFGVLSAQNQAEIEIQFTAQRAP